MTVSEKPSKGAEKILLAQIKQEFAAPAEAIEQYIDLVEEFGVKNNLNISSEINQIKEAEDKLLSILFRHSSSKILIKLYQSNRQIS